MNPQQSRAALAKVSRNASDDAVTLFRRLGGTAEVRRLALLDTLPSLISYYGSGAGTLAADFYDERREIAGVKSRFASDVVVLDRAVKIRRAIAWATEPLFVETPATVEERLVAVVQPEAARPYRDTILGNRRRDPASAGWRRVQGDSCGFCRMLADRGAVYKEATARFASHPNCDCSAEPVFMGEQLGPEASVIQYVASRRSKTAGQRAALRDYLATYYPD